MKLKKEKRAGDYELMDILSADGSRSFAVKKIEGGRIILYSMSGGVTLGGKYEPEQIAALGYQVTGNARKRDIKDRRIK